MDPLHRIGRFEIVKLLGRGGMGEVYLARDPVIDRLVAVKLLGGAFDQVARDRFGREARAAGRLDHQNIVTIFDVGEHDDRPFIAMEYVPGETLAAIIRGRPGRGQGELLRLVEDACAGLAFAHRSGVVHLDVKPENLIRHEDGRIKILDFGLARVVAADETHSRHSAGTLRYMSPEQLAGGEVDHRSDVFGVGCVLFEAVTGQPAFGSAWPDVLARVSGNPTPRLSDLVPRVHPALERMTGRAMALDPAERYDDLEELRGELATVRREIDDAPDEITSLSAPVISRPVSAPRTASTPSAWSASALPGSSSPAPLPPSSRRWWPVALVGAAVAGAAILALTWGPTPTGDPVTASPPRELAPAATAAGGDRPAAPTNEPSATSAPADSAFASSVWEAVARRDRRGALQLLRAQPAGAAPLLGPLTEAARTAALEARGAADTRGRAAQTSPSYRAAGDALARATRLTASDQPLDALAALWDAADRFLEAAPVTAPAGRAVLTPPPAPPAAGTLDGPVPPLPGHDAGVAATHPAIAPAQPPATEGPPPALPPVSAAPAAEPVTARPIPAPAAASTERPPSADEAVRAVLSAYQAAYDQRDVSALRRTFPALSAEQGQALTRMFADAVSYRMDLRVIDLAVGPATARATCEVSHTLVPKVGSASRNTQRSIFHLTHASDGWVIQRVDSSAR